ncbi:hypothetical protein INT48_007955 [Thamnidium elegans]|uniref:Uncharacterized protein n=1 Tax=Thamnidium elegans TaxID=101142 RepID=A0A8H7STK8_9FUNG|nr:hypothetical protein INT48_007955 [Thamnidium elegans]
MSLVQILIKKSNNNIYISNQLFPFICVFIIAKTPAILLVGFALGYMMIQPTNNLLMMDNNILKMIEAAPDLIKKPLLLEDNANSIEFENLMKFPSCPTTLPRLDTHFNFVIDHDIKSPDSADIDCQLETSEQHPLLLAQHQLQQENLPEMFTNEKDNLFSLQNRNTTTFEGPKGYGIAAHIPFHAINTDAAILMVENESEVAAKKISPLSIDIEDLLLFPSLSTPTKPSMSSPGQLFKSKFQKAVKKMKKTSNLMKNEDSDYKRSSTFSNTSSKRAASLQLNSSIK